MKVYTYALLCFMGIILSGCRTDVPQSEAEALTSNEESIVLKNETAVMDNSDKKKEEYSNLEREGIEVFRGFIVNEQIASPIGQSMTYFKHYGQTEMNYKVYILNTGTESFMYKIKNIEDDKRIASGILDANESFEQVFNNLPKGSYVISYVVEEEEHPIDIAFLVQVTSVGYF